MNVIIAQCTDDKKSGKHKAKDLYMKSRLFKAQRRYADAYADEWFILSGKHGLMHPDVVIQSYDWHISNGYKNPDAAQERHDRFFERASHGTVVKGALVGGWDSGVLSDEKITFELICGEEYADRLEWYLDHYNLEYSKPFEGIRYADRIKAMQNEARKQENFSLSAYAQG